MIDGVGSSDAAPPPKGPRVPIIWGAVGVIAVALGLRLWGLRFGLPHLYYWDEPTIVNRAMRFGTGDLNPHFFAYPALYMYVIFAIAGGTFVALRLLGVYSGVGAFAKAYFTKPTAVYLAARSFTALVGTLTVYFTFSAGRRLLGTEVAILAAALIAVSPVHATNSHFSIADTAQGFFVVASLLPLSRILSGGRARDYFWAGALIGLGTAAKYMAVLNAVTLISAHGMNCWSTDGRLSFRRALFDLRLICGLLCVPLAFFAGAPFTFLDFSTFLTDFSTQAALSRGTGGLHGEMFAYLLEDFGAPACALTLVGLLRPWGKDKKALAILLPFPLLYLASTLPMAVSFARYTIPLSPFLALFAARGVQAIVEQIAERTQRDRRWPLILISALALAWPLFKTASWDWLVSARTDPRTLAREYCQKELPRGAKVVLQSMYGKTFDNVPLVTDASLERLDNLLPKSGRMGAVRDEVLSDLRNDGTYKQIPWSDSALELSKAEPQFVILTSTYGSPSAEVSQWLRTHGVLRQEFPARLPPGVQASGAGIGVFPTVPPDLKIYEIVH